MNAIWANAGAVTIVLMGALFAQAAEIEAEAYRPSWQVGQQWIVETECRQTAARRDPPVNAVVPRIRWRFTVEAIERVEDRDCFRLSVACLARADPAPVITLWVDRPSMTLRQWRARMPSPDGWRTLSETYRAGGGQPFPAVAPLSSPPLGLPLFQAGTKGTETYEYEATTGPGGVKALDEVGFSYAVKQQLTQPAAEAIKDLVPETYAKSPARIPTVEVRLEAGRNQVRQLWQPGVPWPVYSSNGVSQGRLIEVTAAPENGESRRKE